MDYKKYHRDKTYKENESHFKNIFKTRFVIANRLAEKHTRVLDIGASTGAMLDLFKDNGYETWGIELSVSSQIAKEKGHKIYKIYFENAKLPENYFDVIVMNHTLEHLDGPLLVLKKIYKLLKKDGIVLIDVPNASGLASKIMKNKWPYRLPKEHKQQFTKKSLSKFFADAGFKIIFFKSRSGIFEFYNPVKEIWEALITGKKRFFTDIINIPYDILVTAVNMGDSMTMVGRK